jgi:hypothetical protein
LYINWHLPTLSDRISAIKISRKLSVVVASQFHHPEFNLLIGDQSGDNLVTIW